MSASSLQTDVAIVGGGIAGTTTALELLEHDHDALILDRDVRERVGGGDIHGTGLLGDRLAVRAIADGG